jgi:shikimate kinase
VLTGFMGSGKTTLGRLLAKRLRWQFLDLDGLLERRAGRSVAAIFAESGEAEFRRLESEALVEALRASEVVLALGGGTLETAPNAAMLSTAERTHVVLLSAPFPVLYERCVRQSSDPSAAVRPLLGDRDSVEERLIRRERLYRAAAHVVLDTSGQSPEESVAALLETLRMQDIGTAR